jgi:hypothetical protein
VHPPHTLVGRAAVRAAAVATANTGFSKTLFLPLLHLAV